MRQKADVECALLQCPNLGTPSVALHPCAKEKKHVEADTCALNCSCVCLVDANEHAHVFEGQNT